MDSRDGRPRPIDARGASGVQIGNGLQINILGGESLPARSAYLYQVRSIAPERLLGREAELAELTDFCTRPGGSAYRWWRAKAWAGKSALLSWFVLHPPAGVHVVSFFVTARFAGQSDREAFIDVVMEQLAALLGRRVPAHLTDATRAAHLLALLDSAATACREQGSRLVLVVDGLDEDLGVTTGPDAYSIAALLPARPPAGMRVIVAGRLAPPLPGDVPGHHPLRESDAVRLLEPSPDAEVIRDAAKRELKRLLIGTPTEQDLLGLLAAAGGGLSVQDLVELTGTRDPWMITETLDTVSGRTFQQRPVLGRRGVERPGHVYLLAHEDLQEEALSFLAGDRLADYRRRLHGWVDGHRSRGWGADTPGYLLAGYFRSLRAEGDTPRMLSLALDPGRHAWLLDTTGGDAAALAELTATRDAVLGAAGPNLPGLAKVALCRMRLSERNASLPLDVPVVWVLLGRVDRARALAESMRGASSARALAGVARETAAAGERELSESIARSITEPDERARALSAVAAAAARDGDVHRAAELADAADRAAERIDNVFIRASCWALMATDAGGDRRRAAALARAIRALADDPQAPTGRSWLEADLAAALASAGEHAEALAVARAIDDPERRARALSALARTVARSGDLTSAYRAAAEAETAARAVSGVWLQLPMAMVIEAMAAAGASDRADELSREAVDGLVGGSGSRPALQVNGDLAVLAGAVARAGDHDRAEALARDNPDAASRARALAAVAEAVVRSGDHSRGHDLVSEAQDVARAVRSPVHHQVELAALAGVVARSGDIDWALAIAGTLHDPARAGAAQGAVARAAANAGHWDRAETIAHSVEEVSGGRDAALALVARAALDAGGVERAVEIIATIETTRPRILALAALAGASEASGNRDDAVKVMDWLVAGMAEAGDELDESSVLALAEAVADAGGVDQCERVARMIQDFALRARALAAVARAAARGGHLGRATALVDEAEATARGIGGPHDRKRTLASLIETINGTANQEQAVVVLGGETALARPVEGTSVRIRTLAVVSEVIAWTGDHARAAALAAEIEEALAAASSHGNEELLAALARAAAGTGHPERAEKLADRITHPEIRSRILAHLAGTAGPGAAQRLTARAFAIDLWTAVEELEQLDLDVQLLLAEDLAVAGLRTSPPGAGAPPPVKPTSRRRRLRAILHWLRRSSRRP
ncbi:hypothetical protein [Streptomyces sp. SID9727]|uniref:hypothetical protein n=1 Tax=Streptomyces sp. SID9727 TaxID=2706114 RepID=UPI0013CBE87D|nr:hypothetical protein [Streptomyces sp. SID9727]NEC68881.1 hypothetical protein [Streptomyces sp. SID9727]